MLLKLIRQRGLMNIVKLFQVPGNVEQILFV